MNCNRTNDGEKAKTPSAAPRALRGLQEKAVGFGHERREGAGSHHRELAELIRGLIEAAVDALLLNVLGEKTGLAFVPNQIGGPDPDEPHALR